MLHSLNCFEGAAERSPFLRAGALPHLFVAFCFGLVMLSFLLVHLFCSLFLYVFMNMVILLFISLLAIQLTYIGEKITI